MYKDSNIVDKYYSILGELSNLSRNDPNILEIWVGGSVAEGTYDLFSNINLNIKFIPKIKKEYIIEFFDRASIIIFGSTDNICEDCKFKGLYKDYVWIDTTIYNNEKIKPLKNIDLLNCNNKLEKDELSKINPFIKIDHWNDQKNVKEELNNYFQEFFLSFNSLEAGLGRNDFFVISFSIEKMRTSLINASLLISKYGNLFDSNRIDLYLHENTKELLKESYQIHLYDIYDRGDTLLIIEQLIRTLLEVFEYTVYDYELLFNTTA